VVRQAPLARRLRELDRKLFVLVAGSSSPLLDRALPALSRAADNSKLWISIAGSLRMSCGQPGRRAAIRGLGSLAVTSAVVNLAIKPIFRRRRPSLRDVPVARRLRVQPLSTSFPSGHSASAAAFAVGASLELPAAAPALGLLAGGVACSRVYTGVHYPVDVLVGSAIGAGFALASVRHWPRASLAVRAGG
jgi:membrane-associated phospholipid phosphatase